MKTTRPDFDTYFMMFANIAASRSTCVARKVGAVLVRNNHIITTGYNGSPPGEPHCTEEGCLIRDGRCIRTIHAEQNTIIQAALHGQSTRDSTLYSTYRPCHVCARMIIGAGIIRVVYVNGDPQGDELALLSKAGIQIVRFNPDEKYKGDHLCL